MQMYVLYACVHTAVKSMHVCRHICVQSDLDAELDRPHCEHDGARVVLDEVPGLRHLKAPLFPHLAQQRRRLQRAIRVLVVWHLSGTLHTLAHRLA